VLARGGLNWIADWLNGGMGAGMVLRAEAVLIWDDGDEIGRGDCDEQRWVKVHRFCFGFRIWI
jgi:hypothetical protein